MEVEPVNISMEEIATRLITDELPVEVSLEPGDGTRYDFIITRLNLFNIFHVSSIDVRHWLLVNRFVGGNLIGSTVIESSYPSVGIALISNNNNWTGIFLSWWFEELFHALDDYVSGAV